MTDTRLKGDTEMTTMEMYRILRAYNTYAANEFSSEEPLTAIPENGILGMANTTYEDEHFLLEIQVDFDLNELAYLSYIDGNLVFSEDRSDRSADDIADEMTHTDFSGMIEAVWDKCAEIVEEKKKKRIPEVIKDFREKMEFLMEDVENELMSGGVDSRLSSAFDYLTTQLINERELALDMESLEEK